jgi:hypothetical protein
MNDHQEYERLMTDALAGALDEAEQARLDAYLADHPEAARAFAEMQASLNLALSRERPEPPAAFWDGFHDRLEARMEAEARRTARMPEVATWWRRGVAALSETLAPVPRPAWQLAMAVGLIAVGVLIGRFFIGTPTSPPPPLAVDTTATPPQVLQATTAEDRAHTYLGRSKVLLLGLVNVDPEVDSAVLNLPRKQEVARALVAESGQLQADLEGPDQQRLRELVADLEVILLQIANLEAQHDMPGIEMVQHGVERSAILLKINLEEMRLNVKQQNGEKPKNTRPNI